jgi:tRNA-splicing ligase RtcB
MKWIKTEFGSVPIKSWCSDFDAGTLEQVRHLANHPCVFHHIALMADCHVGYGMPIGGVIACDSAVIPNAVGVDIGCGMGAVQTDCPADALEKTAVRRILDSVKHLVPVGEGHAHHLAQKWAGFEQYHRPGWVDAHTWELAQYSLGTLGGGNHFLEIQSGDDGFVWLMLHSGSRNLGFKTAEHHHLIAQELNLETSSADLAWLPVQSEEGQAYIREMNFALDYARENRARMMTAFKGQAAMVLPGVKFVQEINIHHNYAAPETHFGREVWVHRKGATSARSGELGIIPGSMGTLSYIVKGLGNAESFTSCSHGAGRRLGRREACRMLTKEECDSSMRGVVFDGWKPAHGRKQKGLLDLEEAPPAYKDIEEVIAAQRDLIDPLVKLRPLGVLKG